MRPAVIALVLVLSLCSPVNATDRYANSGNLGSQLAAAVPGDRVILAPGTYGHVWLQNKNGAAGQLIQVVALDPANRPVFQLSGNEGIQIAGCSYLLWDGIVMQGATEEGIHLQPFGSSTHHIIMRNSQVTMAVGTGNTDNWKSDQTDNTLFYNCKAITAGDCGFDFVGGNSSLIMRSYVTNNGNSSIHAKDDSYNFGFYKNVFDNAGERSLQFGGNGLYCHEEVAMGNILKGSPYGAVFTTARYCDFKYNTIVNPTSAVIRYLNEGAASPPTGNDVFARNLVQYTSSTYSQGSNTDPASFTYADNFWSKTPTLPPGCVETGRVVGNPQLNAENRPGNPAAKDYGAHAPGMEAAWAAYTNRFAWAWGYASNYDPDAEAGGAYRIYKHGGLGSSIVLNAAGSYAGNNPNAVSAPGLPALPNYHQNVISSYSWDFNGDNFFGDAAGATPALTYAAMVGYGRGAVGTYQIELAITVDTDYDDIKDWDVASVIVVEALPGDATFDGVVNFQDYQILEQNFGLTGRNWTQGDFDDDGDVAFADYQTLEQRFGQSVPEPASVSLLALGGLLLVRRRRA